MVDVPLHFAQRALNTVGFSSSEQLQLFKVIAAILHLGSISVGGTDQAHIRDRSQLEKVCFLLGLDDADFLSALVRPKVKAGREWVVQARTGKQVVDELAALSKALYEKNFGAMVDRINKALGRPSTKTFIGVLDIAGFEIFETNGELAPVAGEGCEKRERADEVAPLQASSSSASI